MSDPLGVLRRVREMSPPQMATEERCELCGELISSEHGHLADIQSRALLCACRSCYLLFTSDGAGGGHYRAIPDRYVALSDQALSPEQWEALQIPVSVAFFFVNSMLGNVAAFYPGPAGATESQLSLESWDEVVSSMPELASMQADVEALLVRAAPNRSSAECFIAPIDACYELVGELRRLWRGFDGGREAKDALDTFFDRVRTRAR